jgi:hypothetical protein
MPSPKLGQFPRFGVRAGYHGRREDDPSQDKRFFEEQIIAVLNQSRPESDVEVIVF